MSNTAAKPRRDTPKGFCTSLTGFHRALQQVKKAQPEGFPPDSTLDCFPKDPKVRATLSSKLKDSQSRFRKFSEKFVAMLEAEPRRDTATE